MQVVIKMNSEVGNPIRVILVAPGINGWGLEQLIRTLAPRFEMEGSSHDLDSAQEALARTKADVALVDMDPPLDGRLLESIEALMPTPVLLLTSANEDEALEPIVLAGLRGIVRRSDPPSTLIKALEAVAKGELWLNRRMTGRIFEKLIHRRTGERQSPEHQMISTLTPRERQMIAEITRDTSVPSKVIADRLCISEHTLRNHLTSVYSKLGLNNRLALYAFAVRHKLDGLPTNVRRTSLERGAR